MGDRPPRLSHQTLRVLKVFTDQPRQQVSGADIARAIKLGSGTLYPILDRLEKAGWLVSEWEGAEPSDLHRPRRRLYRITGLGQQHANKAFQELNVPVDGAAWAI